MYTQQPVRPQPSKSLRVFKMDELRNYFLPSPGRNLFTMLLLNLFALILAIPLIVINTSFLTEGVQSVITTCAIIILGTPLGIGCIRLILYYFRSRPTDQQYEEWVNSWIPRMQQSGLQELSLDISEIVGQPLFVHGMVLPDSTEAEFYRQDGYPVIKQDQYGHLHSSINRFIFFYPTRHDIAIFTCDVNALYTRSYRRAQRYFYSDIVGVETVGFNLQSGNTATTLRRFELHVANGQDIGMPVFISDPTVMRTVGSLNALLREHKHGPGRRPAGL